MTFSQTLDKLMTEKNVSAYRIEKDIGISNSLIGYYRRGERDPSAANLIKIADYFDISVDFLLGRSDEPRRR